VPYTGITLRMCIALTRYGNKEFKVGWKGYSLSKVKIALREVFYLLDVTFIPPNSAKVLFTKKKDSKKSSKVRADI